MQGGRHECLQRRTQFRAYFKGFVPTRGAAPDKIAASMCTSSFRRLPAALVIVVSAASVHAQTPPSRLGLCAACHGERGAATAKNLPNLAGQNVDYLRGAIEQYRSGARDVAAMRASIGMINAAELDEILRWYSAQSAPSETK
jgi:cytochrome c553